MKLSLSFFLLVVLGLSFFSFRPQPALAADDWLPLDPEDLKMSTSVVEKDADAEAIFWQVRVADEIESGDPHTVLRHYLRIKIFTDRGRESQSKIDIPYLNHTEIKDIAARTIKPNGSIVELNKADIFDRTIVKKSGTKLKAKSFAMPGVEAGSIIEYRWREIRKNNITQYDRFDLQRDIPVRLVKYFLKPANFESYTRIGMSARTFHGNTTPFVKEKDGFYSTTMTNVPALREEPRMPPENELRAWMLVYYTDKAPTTPEKLWPQMGRDVYEEYKATIKVTDELKRVATETVGDATTPEDKLHRLFDYCRLKIRNINDDAENVSAEERAKMKENKNASDVLKRGSGTGYDIDVLFTALATAAGFEARITRTSDRGEVFFDPRSIDDFLLNIYNVAVKVGDDWKFFDPASKYVPFGMLRWQEEGQQTLVTDPKAPLFVVTPLSAPEKSRQTRKALFRLSEDGTLEGDVRIEYTGHLAAEIKEENDDDSPVQREETLKESVKQRLSTAELSSIKIENVTDPEKPFVYAYHIKVPGYAQRTGRRLFVQPFFFEHGIQPIFSTEARKYPVYFSYPWSEYDDIAIELPAGYAIDNADSPAPFSAGGITEYKPTLGITSDGKRLVARRSFFFGGGGNILFPVSSYAQLKRLFDDLNKADNHTISLKQSAPASTPN